MSLKTTVRGHAKLNLFFDITRSLPNGYHSINSVMQQLDLADMVTIEVTDGEGYVIHCDNPDIPCDERNIAYRACELFAKYSEKKFGAEITIAKHIPLEAGMGGSSADGAAVLIGLNQLFDNFFPISSLCQLSTEIGSDLPFCIRGGTCICQGMGELLTPIRSFPSCCFVIALPDDFRCGTKEAYRLYDNIKLPPQRQLFGEFIKAADHGKSRKACAAMYNVFQELYNNEQINKIADELRSYGALNAIMTGSGSAVFGVFETDKLAKAAHEKLPYKTKFFVRHTCKE